MQMNIIVNLSFEGVHYWPGCDIEEVSFLRMAHRHVFHVCCKKKVEHTNRQIEIICLKREIHNLSRVKYEGPGIFSCEDIARDLLVKFNLDYCSVLEDGENGAEIYK